MYGTEPWYKNVTMKIYLVTRAQNLSSYYTVTTITVTVPHNKKPPVINQTRFLRNLFLFDSPYFSKYIYVTGVTVFAVQEISIWGKIIFVPEVSESIIVWLGV